jgi:L-ascorbate metabolism protein UlaG (beta-lactamase superfamily)
MLAMSQLQITWLGHSTFVLQTPGGTRIVIDPWLAGNPACPETSRDVGAADLVLVTHGHFDHTADVVPVASATGAQVIAPYELATIFQQRGLTNVAGMNIGGTMSVRGLSITMVNAVHSSSIEVDGRLTYAGLASGYVITLENGLVAYFAGDTAVFSDMALIRELYKPSLAFLPIGDLFTMGPDQAAVACRLLGVSRVVPMHWGTFPMLTGTPARLRELVAGTGVEILDIAPGQTIEA